MMKSYKISRQFFIIFLLMTFLGLILNALYASALDTHYSNYTPGDNSTITVSNPKISTYVISTFELDNTTVSMKVNDTNVTPTFLYKGKWIYYYGKLLYSITDRKEGTISFDASNLKDGLNKVEVSIKDKGNNILSDSWSFTVSAPPTIDGITPADKSELVSVDKVSAVVKDNDAINWDTLKMKVNNADVEGTLLNINQDTGLVTYNKSLTTGNYTVYTEAKDINGHLASKTWTFIADSDAPAITSLANFNEGITITDGVLKFTAALKDLVDIKDNAYLKLDNSETPLATYFKYDGYKNSYGYYIIRTKKEASITYEGPVPNGSHTLSLYTEDKLGNKITRSWNFSVATKPVVSSESPIKYGVDLKPTISAVVKSPNGSIDPNKIDLLLDGVKVDHNYDPSTGLVSYTPTANLKNEKYYSVKLIAYDTTGFQTTKEWKFLTNTYPDMSDSNASNCKSCHPAQTFSGSNGILEDVHSRVLYFSGSHSSNECSTCHAYITVPAGCSQCHSDPDGSAYQRAPHGSTANIKYSPKNNNPAFPLRVTQNREQYDCIVCHQPGSQVKGYVGYLVTPTRLLNNHDIPELHKTPDESCTKCHAQSLTREHARDGRKDASGNPITCNTCHTSTDPEVVKAIQDKVTDCSTCHGQATHDSLHVYSDLSENCSGCHSNTLTTEHLKRENITCSTCHDSQNSVVVNAVASGNKNCQTCHTPSIHENIHAECKNCHNEAYKDQLKYLDNVITIH